MHLLELLSGTKSVSKAAKRLGWDTTSLDIDPKHSRDLCMKIADLYETQNPRAHLDFIWASCPCEAYSQERKNAKITRDEAMRASDELSAKTLQIITYFDKTDYCIENPAFYLVWTREVADNLLGQRVITSYCCFDFPYRKPTRLASSFPLRLPRCPRVGLSTNGGLEALTSRTKRRWWDT